MAEQIISPGVFQIESDQSLYSQTTPIVGTAIVGPTAKGLPLVPTYVTSYSQYQSLFGEVIYSGSYSYEYFTSIAAREFFSNGGGTLLVTSVISGSAGVSIFANAGGVPTVAGGTGSVAAFNIEALTWGDIMNNTSSLTSGSLASGSAFNIRWEVSAVNTGSGTFTLAVRRGDDYDANKNYLEVWSNLSLDPNQNNYINRVIGDQKLVYTVDANGNSYIATTGSYANVSQYIRITNTNPQINSLDNLGNYKTTALSGSLPAAGSGSYGGSFSGGLPRTTTAQLFNENITATNIQGYAPADYQNAFNLLTNADDYQFNVIIAPGVGLDNSAASSLIALTQNRGDSFSPVDTGVYGTLVNQATQNAAGQSSNYSACYYPWVQLYNSNLGKAVWVPPTTVIGGVLAFNDSVGQPWFAPAGINRGGIPDVLKAERRLSQTDRDTLYSANVNPLATFPNNGVVVFGQKTLQRKPTSLDRVNVRRLLIALKQYIGGISRGLVFEQNTNTTRNKFLSQVNPYLDSIVSRQGLYAYKVVMDDTNNTPSVIDRNQLVGQIYIQPTKTAEFIILNYNIQPTGATFPA